MSKEVILDNEHASLYYHPDDKIVHHCVHKFIQGEPFRELLTKGAELLEEKGAERWLSDDRANTIVSREDTEWGQENWFPRVLKAGWKHWAIIKPKKIMGELNIKQLSEQYAQLGINAKIFSDFDEAVEWLKSQ